MTGHEAKKAATKKNAGVVYRGDAGDGYTFEVYYCKRRKRQVWTSITPYGERTSFIAAWDSKILIERKMDTPK